MKLLKNEKTSIALIVLGILLIVFAIISFLWMDISISSSAQIKSDKWGQFGDFIGGLVGTIWALAGVLLFYLALTEQRQDIKTNQKALELQVKALNKQVEEFELQRIELESSRKVYEQQTKTIKIQQFESHFYALLNVYMSIKSSLNLNDEHDDYFHTSFNEMTIPYEESTELLQHHGLLVESYITLFNKERGHLSHYFKCFYRLIKIIDTNPFLTSEEKIQYAKILRSQITDYEQLIMQYNSFTTYGQKARPYILKYNILKHVPIFQKSQFKYYSDIQKGFKLLHFSEYFNTLLSSSINQSFDMSVETPQVSQRENSFNSLININFNEDIVVEITCEKDISNNGILLSNDQFLKFVSNTITERLLFSTYTGLDKISLEKYITETDDNRIFGIKIKIEEGVVLNLNIEN